MNFLTEIKQKLNTQLSDLNTPKFSGAIDVIVIQHENDFLSSTPFYIKFGKIGVTEPTEKTVELKINNKLKAIFKMIFKENGDAEYVLNTFKIIEKEIDLIWSNNKSNNLLDNYFESKMNDLNNYQIKSEPVFYVSDDDEDLKVLSEWLDESESLFVHKEISNAFQTYSKVFTLTSDQLKGFNLNLGSNEISYSVSTKKEEKTIYAHIYQWSYKDKIVISDLDGTITKSDLRGQIFHTIGKGWFHNDVAELYDKISQNNYRFVYLSARSILQSRSSKNLINTVKQDEFSLPNGPLLLNPSSLLTSLTIELTNNSDDFKISCLNSLRQIFKTNPFFAGFGNKTTDLKTYKEIGIDENLIFIVNQTGFINNDLKLSYKKLINYVNFIFPKI